MKALLAALILLPAIAQAQTPKLNIKLQHESPGEQRRKEQIERLAAKYDLKKYTITRDILIDQQAINHSTRCSPRIFAFSITMIWRSQPTSMSRPTGF